MDYIKMKDLRLGAVYGASPVFCSNNEDMGYVELADLPISKLLNSKIDDWNMDFQRTYIDDYPPDSGFKTEEELESHNQSGMELSRHLQNELGSNYHVEFIPLS
jgi:hypothetical protein